MQSKHPFPFASSLSLVPLADYWREIAEREDVSPLKTLATQIHDQLASAPELLAPIEDHALLKEHKAVVDLMMTAVFPMALRDQTMAAAFVPFRFEDIYSTSAFERRINLATATFHSRLELGDSLAISKIMEAYHLILKRCYGVNMRFDFPLVFSTEGKSTGLDKYYRVSSDPSFCTVTHEGALKQLSDDEKQRLVGNPMNLKLWQEFLPPELFTFSGFMVMTAVEVTDEEVISLLKRDLLKQDAMTTPKQIDDLEKRLRTLLRCPHLQMGLIYLERNDVDAITDAHAVGRSLLIQNEGLPECPDRRKSAYSQLLRTSEPVVISDLTKRADQTAFEQCLLDHNFRSVVLAPLILDKRLIGILELASPVVGALNALNVLKLQEVIALFATALKRSLDEQEDRLQAVIKRQYTALHPVVEWRFREAAKSYLRRHSKNRNAKLEPIVFSNVHPLYGLSDVRNSSTKRNAAIQADLLEQLGLALAVIIEAGIVRELPILDEIGFRIEKYVKELQGELKSDHELSVLDFLRYDVEPLFGQLGALGERVAERIEKYRAALDPELNILYRRRRDFDESIQLINDTISNYLEEQEEQAQQMFPHYFEKYKTDGVDHNIYVGAALLEEGEYDPLYLRNMRLWQLKLMCGVTWELDALMPKLKVPLETTHLILVQDAPLTIRFRLEEKQFDVDGAYNIRYEIVKKRIDKATIKGSGERLTQPRQIAIVYSQSKEISEYHTYLDYLHAAGFIEDGIEEFELDDMQGIHGLKALRVSVCEQPPKKERTTMLPEDVISTIDEV